MSLFQSFFNELQENKSWKLILSAAATVDKFLNSDKNDKQNEGTKMTFWLLLTILLRSPITLFYYFYLWLPLFWCTLFVKYIELIVKVSARRSIRVKNLMKHVLAFYNSVKNLYHHIRDSHPMEIVNWLLQTCFEVIFTAINGSAEREMEEDCAELLLYEEFQEKNPIPPSYKKRMRMLMHYDVSSNPFFASVRLHSHSRGQTPLRTRANTAWSEAGSTTPGSIPPSPNLRALCLGKSYDKVNNVLYTARDKLRLEVRRSDSTDEITKRTAATLIDKAKFGTYDPFHTAQNIRLSNGNHCARRISVANRCSPNSELLSSPHPMNSISSCSTRSSLSIMRNAYVYIEYFIKSNRSPSVTLNQPKPSSTPCDLPPLGQIDHQPPNENLHNSPPSPLPLPSVHSPTKRYNGDAPGVYLGIASCDFPLHGGVPVGLSDNSISISPNGFINISAGPTHSLIDNSEHGTSLDYHVQSYPIQAHVSSGDRIGMLLYISSSSLNDDELFSHHRDDDNNMPNLDHNHTQVDRSLQQDRSSDSWNSFGLPLAQNSSHDANSINENETENFEITFNLNGYPFELPWDAREHLVDISWGELSLYPTVSFMDSGTCVWSGFSADDVIHRDRKSLGAPHGVVVYCLDGSILLEKDE